MNKLAASFILLVLTGSVALAFRIPWNNKVRPPISLPEAYTMAARALGSATNEFYCIGAHTQTSRSQNGEWLFEFGNTNAARKDVFVFLDGTTKPQIVDGGVLRD
jgi:hypothetical protein